MTPQRFDEGGGSRDWPWVRRAAVLAYDAGFIYFALRLAVPILAKPLASIYFADVVSLLLVGIGTLLAVLSSVVLWGRERSPRAAPSRG